MYVVRLNRSFLSHIIIFTCTRVLPLFSNMLGSLVSKFSPGSHVKSFFRQLADGESAGGTTTIGDRAVAGARKMLNLQSAGATGLVEMVNDLAEGQLSNSTTTALIQAVSRSHSFLRIISHGWNSDRMP